MPQVCGSGSPGAQPPAEETRLEVQLQNDGDARWTIVATVPLENEGDVDSFRSFAEAFEGGEQDFRLGVDVFERAAEAATEATGREMSVGEPSRSAELIERSTDDGVDRYGELRVSFVWKSFARVDENGTMYVGDAFNTTDGTWLSGLGPNQTLVIRSAPGYTAPTTSPIGADDGDLRWEGPASFEPGYFEIVYQPAPDGPFESPSTALLVGALALSGTALPLGVYLLWRRREETGVDGDGEDDGDAGDDDGGDDGDDAPALELLSDEERVEHLLEQHGGRMKQAKIVKETGWSNAKVSQLLSSMEDDDRVDKLRIGRENLISLPTEGVTDIDPGEDS
ncbi:hypothetical protein BRC88_05575 [Halobacteriales archaeon QS_4_69_225]|nr:MAG: hypothetical protein BRC88_05575 [Halobacteriales archaeon QS_4_69_225]